METAKCRTFHTGRLLFSAERVLFDVSTDYLLTGRSFETLHIQKLQADGSWREKLHERRLCMYGKDGRWYGIYYTVALYSCFI